MSHSHQSQANLLTTCDNEFSQLAKVSGHTSRNEDAMNLSAKQSTACKNNFNFSRVSLKALKHRIKLSNSHSLTFSQTSSLLLKSSSNKHDNSSCNIITNNRVDSADYNKKNLIKSKSITECLTKVVIDGGVAFGTDDTDDCNESRVNSISYQSDRFIRSDDAANLLKKQTDKENEADNDGPLGHIDEQRTNDTNQYLKRIMPKLASDHPTTTTNINSDFAVTDEHDDKSMMMAVSSRGIKAAASSSCSSSSTTSNENNNEIVACKGDRRTKHSALIGPSGHVDEKTKRDDIDETKLLNVNQSTTNPFLEYDQADGEVLEAPARQNNENETSCKGDSIESTVRSRQPKRPNQPSKEDFNHDELDLARNNGVRRRAATMTAAVGAHDNDLSPATMLISNCINGVNTHSTHIIKTAIPTRAFQRQDYSRPGEDDKGRDINNIDGCCVVEGEKRERKLFKLGKKSGNLFHIPTFGRGGGSSSLSSCGKPMTPSMRNVSLHYPSKTSTIVDCSSMEKRGSLPSRAKYQLIKLGQRCKILTHHHQPATTTTTTAASMTTAASTAANMVTMPRLGAHTRMSLIKASKQQKRHYYNEVNKSYHLDDFIRKTHLLNNMLDEAEIDNENGQCYDNDEEYGASNDDAIVGYQFDCGEEDNSMDYGHRQFADRSCSSNNVVYKSYKSEIDLTRNLTYLDAFLNEHFEASSSSPANRSPRQQRHHKRMKSSTKSINYSPRNVNRQQQQQQDEGETFPPSTAMINDETFDDIDDMAEEQRQRQASFADGNVTSSSFEYTTVVKAGGGRKQQQQDLISVGRSITANTATSSSLSSSDYASVFSNEAATKSKLISTPEELQQQHDEIRDDVKKLTKVKKSRARRSSQPIPELTNALANDNEQFLLFDDANFVAMKRSMKNLHPDFYNSVPQFEDFSSVDMDANFRHYNGDCDGSALLINPFLVDTNSTSAIGKRQLSYNIDSSNAIHHRDYLEHFQQQQMLGQQHPKRSDATDSGYIAAMMRNGMRPRTSTYSSSSSSTNHRHNETSPDSFYPPTSQQHHHHAIGSVSDLYGGRKAHSQSISSTAAASSSYAPHRVIVSKSKKQKGELVLEYEC